jgi:hypothetical protein
MADSVGSADDRWILAPGEHALVMTKNRANQLGFAILLTFFRERGRFPRHESEVEPQGIAALSRQLDVVTPVDGRHSFRADRRAPACRNSCPIPDSARPR